MADRDLTDSTLSELVATAEKLGCSLAVRFVPNQVVAVSLARYRRDRSGRYEDARDGNGPVTGRTCA